MDAESPKGVVVAGHAATAEAAASALRAGGNAVDAVVAGVFASFIAEPVLTGPLGGGLLSVQFPSGEAHVLDGFARMPGLGGPRPGDGLDFGSVHIDFGPVRQEFHIGRGAAAVPGTLRALFEAHRRWGTRPLEALVEPACELAVEGVPLSPQMAFIFTLLEPILLLTAGSRALFAPHGTLLRNGELHHNPVLGDLLRRLAREGLRGPTGRALDAAVLEAFGGGPGLLTERDLRESVPVVRAPLQVQYRGAEVTLPPAPTMGGPLVALGLSLLDRTEIEAQAPAARLRWMAEIQRCMTEARSEEPAVFLGEPGVSRLLESVSACVLGATPRGSTTHISVIDAAGTAAGMTHSNGEGAGHVVPDTGIMMNNFLGEEDINPGGFHVQAAGEAILTMMCPTLVRRGPRRWVLGSGGSNRIRTALLQVLQHLLGGGASATEAVEAPRMHVEGDVLNLEVAGRPAAELAEAVAIATQVVRFDRPNMFFGGVHLAELGPEGFGGAGDARRGGVLVMA